MPNALFLELEDHLARGRRRILGRALWSGAARGGAAGFGAALIVCAVGLLAERTLGLEGGGSRLQWVVLATLAGALLVGIAGAGSRLLWAKRRWPRIWDRSASLPETITTVTSLSRGECRRDLADPWVASFLGEVIATPIPPPPGLRRELPGNVGAALPLIVAALAVLLTLGLLPPLAASRDRPSSSPTSFERFLSQLENAAAPRSPVRAAADEARRGLAEPDAFAATRLELAERLESIVSIARGQLRVRLESASRLAATPRLAPLAAWLRDGATPDLSRLRSLAAVEAERLLQVADELEQAGLREAAEWIRRRAIGEELSPPPLASTLEEIRLAGAAVEWLRRTDAEERAAFLAPELAEGGSTAAAGASNPSEKSGEAAPPEPGDSIEVGPGRRHETGVTTERTPLRWLAAKGSLQWQRWLAHPEIEDRWIPVVEEYRALRAARRQEESKR